MSIAGLRWCKFAPLTDGILSSLRPNQWYLQEPSSDTKASLRSSSLTGKIPGHHGFYLLAIRLVIADHSEAHRVSAIMGFGRDFRPVCTFPITSPQYLLAQTSSFSSRLGPTPPPNPPAMFLAPRPRDLIDRTLQDFGRSSIFIESSIERHNMEDSESNRSPVDVSSPQPQSEG